MLQSFSFFLMICLFGGCRIYYEDKTLKSSLDSPSAFDEPIQPKFTSIQKKIFNTRCTHCHSNGGKAARVPLQTYNDFLESPREIVIPGNVNESGLVISITREDQKKMPPLESATPLTHEEIEAIKEWVANGALED